MRDVSWWDAWSLWWQGQPTDNLRVEGRPLYQWARIGKTIVLASAVPLLFELIGPRNVRAFGERLHNFVSTRPGTRLLVAVQEFDVLIAAGAVIAAAVGAIALLLLLVGLLFEELGESLSEISDFLLNTVAAWSLTVGIAVFFAVGLLACAGFVLDVLVIRPITAALLHPRLEWATKGIALLLLFGGSCIDLLAT